MRPIEALRNRRGFRPSASIGESSGKGARMKSMVIRQFGPPDVLTYEEVPDPQPRAGEIRIRIHAATVNRVLDVSLRAGKESARGPVLPLIPGVDCAGVIDAVGPGVKRWRRGIDSPHWPHCAGQGGMPIFEPLPSSPMTSSFACEGGRSPEEI
jgi:Alcohol dehydrogenase GroES-like domain